ncbi:MAG TPA: ABC transporter permease [Candidatus Thermoplasmatota archaeon]|nr:ABC transporter permease [Candidatus Thermoplasmatota archaeon]
MKLQRIKALATKEIKKTVREPAVLFMIFLFPVVFVFAFGASFGGAGGQPTYTIGVVNLDHPGFVNASQILLTALTETKILNLHMYGDNQTAQNELTQGKIQAVILIPVDFSSSYQSYQTAPNNPEDWTNTTISLYLDRGSVVATQAIPPIVQQVLTTIADHHVFTSPFRLETASLVQVKAPSALTYLAPGMFTFASIFLIMMVAQSFATDRENGMMKRIRTTPTTPTEFMTSQVVSYLVIGLIQAVIVFLMVYFMGFRPAVGMTAYAFAFIVVLVFTLSNIGFGLITATIARSPGAATGLSFLFVLPQLFLGTFVGASLSAGAQIAGRFVPSFYVTDALTSVFLRGASLTSTTVLVDLVVVSISCLAILAVGILLYAKYYKI